VDLSVHNEHCAEICVAGQKLIEEKNHHADSIAQRCDQVPTPATFFYFVPDAANKLARVFVPTKP
jgi:hypothetical protein